MWKNSLLVKIVTNLKDKYFRSMLYVFKLVAMAI